jgi:hypothetical protein
MHPPHRESLQLRPLLWRAALCRRLWPVDWITFLGGTLPLVTAE